MDGQHAVIAQLQESEERYRAVIDNASDMIQSVRPDGTFEFVNPAWLGALGYSLDDLEEMTIWDAIHPDSLEHCQELFGLIMQGQSVDNVEVIFKIKDGSPLPTEGSVTVRIVDGELIATHGFFRDIRERMRADELEVRNAQLEREQRARYLEKMAALGKLAAGLAHELNNPASAAQRASNGMLESLARQDAALRDLASQGASGMACLVLSEVVAKRRGASPLTDMDDPVQVSEREDALGDWLTDHDVREGWKLALGFVKAGITDDDLEQLAGHLPDGALDPAMRWLGESLAIRDAADVVCRSTSRMSELVTAIKSYTYMDRAAEQIVDIHDGLDNTLIILAHRLRDATVTKEYDRSLPPVRAFGSGLNQVWTNIIDNAVDATDGRGTITIRTRSEDNQVIIEIEDNGCGIPPEHLTRIFEPFYTTKAQGRGSGLGLDIVWYIVTDEHHGTIDVESVPGQTVFRISLPLAPDSATS